MSACRNIKRIPDYTKSGTPPLNALRAVQLGKIPINYVKRQMASLARNFERHAIREANTRTCSKMLECNRDNIRILQGQRLVVEQQIDGFRNLRRRSFIDCVEHHNRFRQNKVKYPCTLLNECFGCTICAASSRTNSRTNTLVSTACMLLAYVLMDAFLDVGGNRGIFFAHLCE